MICDSSAKSRQSSWETDSMQPTVQQYCVCAHGTNVFIDQRRTYICMYMHIDTYIYIYKI